MSRVTEGYSPPTFYELQEHAEASGFRRRLTRYLITPDYEKTIRRHKRFGTHIVGRLVMSAIGKHGQAKDHDNNYTLNRSRNRLEASISFGLGGSVFNEAIHTVTGVIPTLISIDLLVEGSPAMKVASVVPAILGGVNLEMVSLQRFNRARMIQRADEELAKGATFNEGYENYFGIDSRAMDNYAASLPMPEATALEANE